MKFRGMKQLIRERVALLEWKLSMWASDDIAGKARPIRRVVILPCDSTSIIGSKGDEAMIVATIETLTARYGNVDFRIITLNEVAENIVRGHGYKPLRADVRILKFLPVRRAISIFQADLLVVLGADVMDGYYSPMASMHLLVVADLVARTVCPAIILGFSFNERPSGLLKPIFNRLSDNVRMYVRDPVSYERFQRFTRTQAHLVADAAFMLTPNLSSQAVRSVECWIKKQKTRGRFVLAFNIHPMLKQNAKSAWVTEIVRQAASALRSMIDDANMSIILLSHDCRPEIGDNMCLEPLWDKLRDCKERILYPREILDASELKGVASLVDAVVTGRMHLAIAALGCGVPVGVFSYQEKFAGLIDYFGLPAGLILSPDRISIETIQAMITLVVEGSVEWKALIKHRLPPVLELSRQNYQFNDVCN